MPKAARGAPAPVILAAVEKSGRIGGVCAGFLAAAGFPGSQSLVHDAADGTGAASALRAAAEAIVDLARGARRRFARRQGRAHIVIGEHVTGADDHSRKGPAANWCDLKLCLEREF